MMLQHLFMGRAAARHAANRRPLPMTGAFLVWTGEEKTHTPQNQLDGKEQMDLADPTL